MPKDISIEYAHIYTNNRIGEEQKLSIEILHTVTKEHRGKNMSLAVMVDDYSFPDTSFDYNIFSSWLEDHGFKPGCMIRESDLIPYCDMVLNIITDQRLKEELLHYVKTKKYPCSLFVATWYLIRLGHIDNAIFPVELRAERLINILPLSFKPYEDKAFEIIEATPFDNLGKKIENKYFEGREISSI